jgi:hypothetical protein
MNFSLPDVCHTSRPSYHPCFTALILFSTEHKLCVSHVAIYKLLSLHLSQIQIFFPEFCQNIRTQSENYKENAQYIYIYIYIHTHIYLHTHTYTQQETVFNRLSVYVCYSERRVGIWQMVPSSDVLHICMLPSIKEFH